LDGHVERLRIALVKVLLLLLSPLLLQLPLRNGGLLLAFDDDGNLSRASNDFVCRHLILGHAQNVFRGIVKGPIDWRTRRCCRWFNVCSMFN